MSEGMSRDRMIVEAMRTGITREQASILTDMSRHAFDEAMRAAHCVIDTCPPEIRLPAFASVLASFATVMRDMLPEHWTAFVATATTVGESAVIVLPERKREHGGLA